jgi:transcriptional regulator with XRE-family HTH domain
MSLRARTLSKSVHSPDQLAFRDLLVKARKAAGLTQQELAKRLGKPQSFVAKYEGGERRLDVVEFVSVARAIGADPSRIVRSLMRHTG